MPNLHKKRGILSLRFNFHLMHRTVRFILISFHLCCIQIIQVSKYWKQYPSKNMTWTCSKLTFHGSDWIIQQHPKSETPNLACPFYTTSHVILQSLLKDQYDGSFVWFCFRSLNKKLAPAALKLRLSFFLFISLCKRSLVLSKIGLTEGADTSWLWCNLTSNTATLHDNSTYKIMKSRGQCVILIWAGMAKLWKLREIRYEPRRGILGIEGRSLNFAQTLHYNGDDYFKNSCSAFRLLSFWNLKQMWQVSNKISYYIVHVHVHQSLELKP